MTRDTFHGDWQLVASNAAHAELSIDDDQATATDLSAWLNGFDANLIGTARPTSGMHLSFADDGSFTEYVTGTPHVEWFDVEGVLQNTPVPFGGIVVQNAHGAYLRPAAIARWAIPVEGQHGGAVLRYDDGDTKITDSIRLIDGRLVRTVSVVTDELYLNRVVIIYQREA